MISSRRAFLSTLGASVGAAIAAATFVDRSRAAPSVPPPVRMAWPWPVRAPDPWATNDPVSALLGMSLFPSLYARAIDGVIEPKLALGAPKEAKLGVRVDLPTYVRPADVVASIYRARNAAAKLWLKDVPIPRVDGMHGVLFPFVGDVDGLMRKLATPLAGIARIEPRKVSPMGAFDASVEPIGGGKAVDPAAPRVLKLKRRNVWGVAVPPLVNAHRLRTFELSGAIDLAQSLRAFERGDTDVAWLGDGLFSPRTGARAIDLGPLAYVAVRAGKDAPEIAHPGGVLGLVDSIAPDRLDHLGLLRRGHLAPAATAFPRSAPSLRPDLPIAVRASMPMLVAAAEVIARELGVKVAPLEDAAMDRALADGSFALALEMMRAIDETSDGAAASLATCIGAPTLPPAGTTPRAIAAQASCALGWEIALIGAQAGPVWIPRAAFGGLDLEGASETRFSG
jgi:hypothetical protein